MRVLVTGMTGQLGAGLVEAGNPSLEMIPLVRSAGSLDGRQRLIRRFPDRPDLTERCVEGDVTARLWGIDDRHLERLAGTTDAVLNLAAVTNWAAPRRRLHSTNVVGAYNGLEVARRLHELGGRCRVYCQISSIHVAGGLVGSVPEAPLGSDGERSAYEHSKWLAEEELISAAPNHDLTVAIARVGGLIGSAGTGATAQRNSLYRLVALWQRLPGQVLPAVPTGRIDILPRDVADDLLGRALLALGQKGSPGSVELFHVCAGSAAPTFEALLSTLRSLDADGRFGGLRTVRASYPTIRWTTQNLDRLWPFAADWRNGIVGHRYLSTPRTFERDRLAALIGTDELPAPSVELLARLAFDLDPRESSPFGGHSLARFQQ